MAEGEPNEIMGTLTPPQYKRMFQNNPELLDLAVLWMVDLFEFGYEPEHQAKANKGREMLKAMGLLKYPTEASGSPTLESLKELLRKMLT